MMRMEIDEQGYKDGGAMFNKGRTLRQLFEAAQVKREEAEKTKTSEMWEAHEKYAMGMFLGFADALITKLRTER